MDNIRDSFLPNRPNLMGVFCHVAQFNRKVTDWKALIWVVITIFKLKINDMRNVIILMLILFFALSCNSTKKISEEWIPLFNGENLDGWVCKFTGEPLGQNYKNTFRVEDGLLVVSYDEYEDFGNKFGHLFTKGSWSHYRIRAEYRFVGEQVAGGQGWAFRNNGLMLHSQSAESMELDQDFPVSIEVQLLGGNGVDERSNLNVCTPGTIVKIDGEYKAEHCYNSTSKTFHGDDWVTVEIEVQGDSIIKHYINGEVVLQYENPILDPQSPQYDLLVSEKTGDRLTRGNIAIQAESHPTEFRKIEILVLDGNE